MWDPDVGAGTVTHQNIGFLFPMGPYYWLVAELHIPMWIGQRFWMGSLFFAAGTGVWYLGRLLGLSRSGRLAAALAYMLTPYVLDYIARISAIVMPWAALGWMVAFTVLAVRKGGWRYPALFAVVIALVGGVNATSILLVGTGPAALGGLRGVGHPRGPVPGRAGRPGPHRHPDPRRSRCGGWPASGPRGPTASTSSSTPRRCRRCRPPRCRRRCSGASATGTSTARTSWGRGPSASFGYLQWTWLIAVSFLVPTLCVAVGHAGPLALPDLRHRPGPGGGGAGRGHLPLQRPHALRGPDQGRRAGLHRRAWPCARPTGSSRWSCWVWPCCWGPASPRSARTPRGPGWAVLALATRPDRRRPARRCGPGGWWPSNLERPTTIPAYIHQAAATT